MGNLTDRPVRGIACMVLGCGLVAINDAILKWLSSALPVGELVCLRGVFVLLAVPLFVVRDGGLRTLRIRDVRGQILLAVLLVASMFLFVGSLATLELATAVSLLFTGPLFATALAVALLGERIGRHRSIALAAGFAGVLMIMRPGAAAFTWVALMPVAAAVCGAVRDIFIRRLSVSESSTSILTVSTLGMVVGGAATAPWAWVPASGFELGLIAVAGFVLAISQFLMIEGLRYAQVGVVVPFQFTTLPAAAILGFVIFGTVPDVWVCLGALLIGGSGIYIARREARLVTAGVTRARTM
ncbi:MAG: DMT family transporter [Gammaproteobacteria bacterium]|nr:DMT family transporter [Gammaproteobacteria bacterium]